MPKTALDNVKDDECCICMDNKVCDGTTCTTCKNKICIDCYIKIETLLYDDEKNKSFSFMKCPVCRKYTDFDLKKLKKKELYKFCRDYMTKCGVRRDCLTDELEQLTKYYNKLAELGKANKIDFYNNELPVYINY